MDPSSTATDQKTINVSLLGPFEVTCNGEPVRFATDTTRALLAYLADESSRESTRRHRREFLATLFWPDQPQSAALTNLRQTIARLRRGLSDTPATDVLEVTRQTLELDLERIDLDCARFESLIFTCEEHAHRHLAQCQTCIRRLEQACALYRGEFLEGVYAGGSQPFEEWAIARREQYHRLALGALHTLTTHYELTGNIEEMSRFADRQLMLESWREDAHRQKMRALLLQGNRTAALDQYETCKNILALELGIEPDTETRALYERLRDDAFAPEMLQLPAPVHNLPAQLTPFVGREQELTEVHRLLDKLDVRLLSLVGVGGMGKTRLALEIANQRLSQYPDGVFFVSLASVARPDAIASTIAAAMGLTLTGDIRQALPRALRDKQLLLVLDNFEHLLDGVETVVRLLEAAPELQIVATSRERLNVLGEQVYMVHGMDSQKATPESAIQLFTQSARRVQVDFTIEESNQSAVSRICELVEGMPLGLELAAARVDVLPLVEIAREIEHNHDFLSSEWRETPERHRSMRAVFDGSWRSLDESGRQTFRQLSVFQGGFTREAANAVAGASIRTLARLAHKSLLHQQDGRYQIHELLRQFGAEQLDLLPDERAVVENRHSEFYLAFVAQRQVALDGEQPQLAARQVQADIDNINKAWMSAVEYGRVEDLDECAIGLWRYYSLVAQNVELERLMHLAAERLETYLDRDESQRNANDRSYTCVLSKLRAIEALALVLQDEFDAAIPIAGQAIALGHASDGIEGELLGHLSKGQALLQQAQYAEAQRNLEKALSQVQRISNDDARFDLQPLVSYLGYLWLGASAVRQNDAARARQLIGQSLEICRQRNNVRGEMHCLANLANVARASHEFALAREYYEQALGLAQRLDFRWGEAIAQQELGDVALYQGDPEASRKLSERALMLTHEIVDRLREAHTLACLGRAHTYLGDDAGAKAYLDRFLHFIEGIETPIVVHTGWTALAARHYHTGDLEQAHVYAQRGVSAARSLSSNVDLAGALVVAGQILTGMNRLAEATEAYQQSITLCNEVDKASEVIAARAGLAQIALAQDDLPEALAYVEKMLATLAEYPDAETFEPFVVYLTCYHILDTLDDPRAAGLLETAHRQLLGYAETITDEHLRRSFLENVSANRELQVVYARHLERTAPATG